MSLQIQPQYVRQADRNVILTLSPSFVSEHPHVRSDNVLIHNFSTRGIVFSIIHNGEMTVFCCAVQISMPPKYGQTQIEITSETQMKYFTENLSSRLPRFTNTLDNQCMFDDDIKADLLRKNGNDVEVVLLTRKLFMVMFDSTIYFFRIDFEYDVFCFKLPLWELNQTTYEDSYQGIRDLSLYFDSFRFFRNLEEYTDGSVCFDLYSNVFNRENYCVCASVTIHINNDTLERSVECSRTLITRGEVDDSPFSSTTKPDFDETRFSIKRLKIREEDSDEDSDEEDSDEEKEDPILAVVLEDENRIYVFEKLDDNDFFCILFLKGVVYLLQVDRYHLSTLKSSNSEKLIAMFERDSVDFSERLEGFGEVDLSCRIEIEDPIQITCDFEDSVGDIVLTQQLIIENDELREI